MRIILAAAALVLVSCSEDVTSPDPQRTVFIQGTTLEAGAGPAPPLHVVMRAWPDTIGGGTYLAEVETDGLGAYGGELGPFPNGRPDSVRVVVTQYACDHYPKTEVVVRDPELRQETITVPSLALSHPAELAQLTLPAVMCAPVVTRNWDLARLAIWLDGCCETVHGRWRLNHSASYPDALGYFSGVYVDGELVLELQPNEPTQCAPIGLALPVGGHNESTIQAGALTGGEGCQVPTGPVRFFQGTSLDPLQPPGSAPVTNGSR
jgi:hypothetical protein